MSPQISSFAVSPTYEIVLFAQDVFEVVNIMDFRSGTIPLVTVMDKLRRFNIDGETKTSTYLLKKIIEYIICVCVCFN